MNKRAQELGMEDTHFSNTNGLPVANHYTSAYDIAVMSRLLIKHDQTKEWFNTWQTNITVGLPGKKQTELGLTNTNRMIKIYPGANGIKTGFTQEAGYCLSTSATKGDLTLIAVVLGAKTSKIRFAEAGRLLDYGFATYDSVKLAQKGEILGSLRVEKGKAEYVNGIAPEDITALVKKGEKDGITSQAEFQKSAAAPLERGMQVGELVLYKNEQEIGRYPITAETDVEKAGLLDIYMRMMRTLVR